MSVIVSHFTSILFSLIKKTETSKLQITGYTPSSQTVVIGWKKSKHAENFN